SLDGAVNLPLSTLRKLDLNGAGLDKNLSYGIYCATGARAQKAAIILQRQGFESLSLLKVGIC
ncbi:MAG: sulfurtransferase, partial [Rhizobiales bacterium]|nr:sulfurtransferase [Hyphomicrobiales bacterium]